MPSSADLAVWNEYDPLRSVLLCRPTVCKAYKPINEVQRHFLRSDPPQTAVLADEYQAWLEVIQRANIDLQFLEPADPAPYQHNTRDIGFTIGEAFFIGRMRKPVRQTETAVLETWVGAAGLPYRRIPRGYLEGGDVLVHYPRVFVGKGERTDAEGVATLTALLGKEWQVIPVPMAKGVLHLDCVMTIIGPETILWCPELLAGQHQTIEAIFPRRIEVSREEVLHMATNVLMLNPETIVIEARQVRLQKELRLRGYDVKVVDWTQLKKFGGLFRCATCPIHRASQ